MMLDDEKFEIRRLKNQWVKAKLEGNTIQANSFFDRIYAWYIIHLNELSFIEYRTFEIFFHMNNYLFR